MFRQLEIFQMTHALGAHAAARQSAISQNVANADTPRYRAVDVTSFAELWRQQGNGSLRASRAAHVGAEEQAFRPRPAVLRQPESEAPNGNTVSLEGQMMKAAEVRHQHDLALSIYRSASSVLRKSLGR